MFLTNNVCDCLVWPAVHSAGHTFPDLFPNRLAHGLDSYRSYSAAFPLGKAGLVDLGPSELKSHPACGCIYILIPHGPNLELIGTAAGRPSNVYVSLKEPTKVTDKVAEHTCATLLKMVVSGSLPMLRFIPRASDSTQNTRI